MTSFSLPARYASVGSNGLSSTFLFRALKAAPNAEARHALLEAVDWDAPEVRRSPAWDVTADSARGHLMFSHPLSAVASVGDEALFADALALAHTRSTRRIYLDLNRNSEAMSDWVSNGVLGTVAAVGTTGMLRKLTHYLALRKRLTRSLSLPLSQHNDDPDPWRQMALFSPRDRSPGFYQATLDELDRYARAQMRSDIVFRGKKLPPPDGTGPLSRWEKQLRSMSYQRVLMLAAQYGHAPMAEAILATGRAPVPLQALGLALEAGAADIALAMLNNPKGLEAWLEHPLDLTLATGRQHPLAGTERLSLEVLLHTFDALGMFVVMWQNAPAEYRAESDAQLRAADMLTLPLLRLLARFPSEEVATQLQADQERQQRQAHNRSHALSNAWPAFHRLDDAGAEEALSILRLQSPDGPTLAALPELQHWAALQTESPSPWGRLQCERVGDLHAADAETYLERMGESIVRLWREEEQRSKPLGPAGEMQTVAAVWTLLGDRVASSSPTEWLETLMEKAGLDRKAAADRRKRWLNESFQTPGASRLRVRM